MKERLFTIEGVEPVLVLGLRDQHLKQLELAFPEVSITARGNTIKILGEEQPVDVVCTILADLCDIALRKSMISTDDVDTLLTLHLTAKPVNTADVFDHPVILKSFSGQSIIAKTPGQRAIVEAVRENDIVFAIGPAGTGKTYTSVALAVKALKERKVKKIVLCRPAVEAGESLGFLPGDLKDKIDPYLRPLYDALEEMIETERLEYNLAKNVIEIVPLAYMRGRTLNNAFVILDEAQNATNIQMKMFLTRLGVNSTAIITGDITQTDLPTKQQSGLISIREILANIPGISFVYLDQKDVVRHKLIKDIIEAYERHQEKKLVR